MVQWRQLTFDDLLDDDIWTPTEHEILALLAWGKEVVGSMIRQQHKKVRQCEREEIDADAALTLVKTLRKYRRSLAKKGNGRSESDVDAFRRYAIQRIKGEIKRSIERIGNGGTFHTKRAKFTARNVSYFADLGLADGTPFELEDKSAHEDVIESLIGE